MKVLYINYLFDKTYSSVGAAVHVKEFVGAAKKLSVEIVACDMNKFSSEEAAVQSKLRAWLKRKLSRYVGQLNALISNIGYFRRELRLVEEHKPDALLVRYNLLNFSAVLIAKLKKLPLVLEVNSPMALESRRFNKQSVNLPFLLEWTEKLNLRLATRAYTVSQALKDYFVGQGIDRNKLRVIPNGVDVQRFSPDVEGCWVREKHHLNGQVVLGFVGSFHYWHGVEYFSEYVRRLSDKHDNVRFLFVGDGPMRRELQQSVIDIGLSEKVILPGYVRHDDIPGYVAVMDIALAPYPPSDFFYFSPLKIFEYMAAGKPTVASDIGQISELIEDGKTGMLYQAGDLDTLISKSSELIDNANLRTNMGTAARQASCEKYSWAANAREIIQLINEALDVRS